MNDAYAQLQWQGTLDHIRAGAERSYWINYFNRINTKSQLQTKKAIQNTEDLQGREALRVQIIGQDNLNKRFPNTAAWELEERILYDNDHVLSIWLDHFRMLWTYLAIDALEFE